MLSASLEHQIEAIAPQKEKELRLYSTERGITLRYYGNSY